MNSRTSATTQANLSIHPRKLEEAGYNEIDESFLDRKPLPPARLTSPGRQTFAAYREAIGRLASGGGPSDNDAT